MDHKPAQTQGVRTAQAGNIVGLVEFSRHPQHQAPILSIFILTLHIVLTDLIIDFYSFKKAEIICFKLGE